MDYFNGQYTDISVTDINGHQDVNKNVIKIESQQIPFSERFRVLHRNDNNKKLEEYRIVDLKDGSTIDRIFRLEDEDPPFFIFVPFKGNDYIITAVNPNVFYIINCNQEKRYSRCLTVNDCDVRPIKASAEIFTTLLGNDLNVRLSFICKFVDKNGSYSYKSIITVLDTLETCEIFTKIDVADVEYKCNYNNIEMDNARCRSVIKDAKDLNCMISPYNSNIGNLTMCNIKIFQDTNDLSKYFSTNTTPMTARSIKDIKVFTTNTGCRYAIYTSGNLENCLSIVNIDRECGIQYNFLNAYDLKVKDILWYDDTREFKISGVIMCPDIDVNLLPFDINFTSADEILAKDNFFFRSEYVRDLFFAHVKFNHYEIPIILPGNRSDNSDKDIRLKHIKSRPVKLKRKEVETMPTKKNETKAAEPVTESKKEDPTPREIISQYAEAYDNMTKDAIRGNEVFGLLSPEHRLWIAAHLDQIVEILEGYIK